LIDRPITDDDSKFKAPGPPPTEEEGRQALQTRLMLYKLFKKGKNA
jgi:hypothetical protein